ncbi:helix-turn-helix domain-containing protein [Streptomyces sp. NPDC093982]|uniref:helix-turn-helix domain-containing protein n=1 Tax=Streptomyces sp. NPDC093982 TaxID=3155077 RepID=UPI0034392DA0
MSYQAQTWVDETGIKLCNNSGELLVLVRVANHTNADMRGCYASAETLAGECLMGESTVLRHLRRLKSAGVLIPGDPKMVSHLRADRRPPVYDLAGGHEKDCPGAHDVNDLCRVASTGAQIEPPSRLTRTTGVRSEHPLKKRRSAGARFEHPQPEQPATGVQIDLSRVFKSSTNSSKDLNSLFSVPADAFALQPSQHPMNERETAAPENATRGGIVDGAGQDDADVVLTAYGEALGRPLLNGRRLALREQALQLLAAGLPVEWIADRAREMAARPDWKDLIKHTEASRIPLPRQRPPAGSGRRREVCVKPGHGGGAFPADDCPRCVSEARPRREGPSRVDTAALIGLLRGGQSADRATS